MREFTEVEQLDRLVQKVSRVCRVETISEVTCGSRTYPITKLVFGPEDKTLPTFGLFGGVHGLEKVGTHLALHYLECIAAQLEWDEELNQRLERCRLVSIPLVNPGGMSRNWRANPRGVDLMRNAPIEATEPPPMLVGGHRLGPFLPWYRGKRGAPMEVESQALVDTVREEIFSAKSSLCLDLHSGFGSVDRLWYPYAKSRHLFPRYDEAKRIEHILNNSYPFHIYKVEPQSHSYTTHGDIWDYLFDDFEQKNMNSDKVFVPWTLEMGSWIWVRKNPLQLFSLLGPFNPLKPHRYRRIMRRHYWLLDFFFKATANASHWKVEA